MPHYRLYSNTVNLSLSDDLNNMCIDFVLDSFYVMSISFIVTFIHSYYLMIILKIQIRFNMGKFETCIRLEIQIDLLYSIQDISKILFAQKFYMKS